jgi:phosphoribosylaminoimidazole-succinocarboxamide synthase
VVVSADALTAFLPTTLSATSFDFLGDRYQGKVRDVYTLGDERFLIATDRQSAFDINWTTIPLKGQVLSQLSAWWFDRIGDILPTHVIAVPDPNVMVAKKLDMLRIEIVARLWSNSTTPTSRSIP